VAQLCHRLALDLADPLAGQLERPPDLVQRLGLATVEAVPHPHDRCLARLEGVEDAVQLRTHQTGLHRRLRSHRAALVGDEVTQRRVIVGADGLVEADQVSRQVDQFANPLLGDVELVSELGVSRIAAQRLVQSR